MLIDLSPRLALSLQGQGQLLLTNAIRKCACGFAGLFMPWMGRLSVGGQACMVPRRENTFDRGKGIEETGPTDPGPRKRTKMKDPYLEYLF